MAVPSALPLRPDSPRTEYLIVEFDPSVTLPADTTLLQYSDWDAPAGPRASLDGGATWPLLGRWAHSVGTEMLFHQPEPSCPGLPLSFIFPPQCEPSRPLVSGRGAYFLTLSPSLSDGALCTDRDAGFARNYQARCFKTVRFAPVTASLGAALSSSEAGETMARTAAAVAQAAAALTVQRTAKTQAAAASARAPNAVVRQARKKQGNAVTADE